MAPGTATISACAGSVCGSTTLTATPPAPNITGLLPAAGVVGTTVSITGTNFGTTPGTVTFNGVTALIVSNSWGDTSISVQVPTLSPGTVQVVVTVSGLASNGVPFTVVTPPAIVAALSPAPNASGWNNSAVTVSFTCTAGSLPIANCPGSQTVSTEGAAQVVTGTVTDTAGDAAIASVSVNIDMTPSVIAVSAPADMTTLSQAAVTITGSASDALSGAVQVTCGGVTGTLSGSAFSCGVTLNVGLNLIVVKATDAAGNVSASKLHLGLAGTLSAPNTSNFGIPTKESV